MKRRREFEMVASEIRSAIEEVSLLVVNLKTGAAAAVDDAVPNTAPVPIPAPVPVQTSVHIQIKPFLSLCNLLVQVLDKIGPTMAVLRQDIRHNIERLEKFYESDPSIYWDVVEILKKEVNEGKAKKGPTCSKAFVWLNRSLDFALALLELLVKDFGRNMEEAVEASYITTLKPWHGWISSAAYKVALKLVPDSRTFVDVLKVKGEEDDVLKKDIQNLISLLIPVLEQNKDILRAYGLDKLKST
ncbi:glycolipid transfer protein 3-like isoform X2 [Salvia miltiorrhiza]|nr:glycolipid transfer protein 3-like isoform X2 [Salvia miltiorrhiza]XP_057795538.1 glycolipid transfer protein 3-like isoform X2 [Salvia miltiorrhiza]XP_057795539.1 glycolipid transfer protein 3-like isoform X2 [Salvia miltiorrhiza]XP_057795540.1 glycolipid transfer protein 3-like isoform X2 [Salvia miltiorrhiza]